MTSTISINHNYENLSSLYIGKFGEYLVKLTLSLNSIDTYTPEVDNKGIDFVARVSDSKYYDVQVKTVRLKTTKYVFVPKHIWSIEHKLRDNLLLAVVLLKADAPLHILLIPATAWINEADKVIFSDRNYEGKKSKPEWGLSLSDKHIDYLVGKYEISKVLTNLSSPI